jgi:hypothetical protein
VYRIIFRLMSNETQKKFNLTGTHGKLPFSDALERLVIGE